MNSFITGQIQTVIENLYLLESSFRGSPSLESDIQRVRQSINLVKGVDLVIKQPTSSFLVGERSLFGRYWGAIDRIPNLHFETCFYQPIEYCISNRLHRFAAGAQGEHKLNRGLIPTPVLSMHWLRHSGFFDAVQRYTQSEWEHIEQYQTILRAHSPYRKEQ